MQQNDSCLEIPIQVKDFSFTYRDADKPALQNINLEFKKGKFTVILGSSGAGKSTLCFALNGLIPHSIKGVCTGEVLVNGVSNKARKVAQIALEVGLVFQDFEMQLFCSTVELEAAFGTENYALPRDEIIKRVKRVLAQTGLAGFEARQPATMSGGEKQRLAIASILTLEPNILCFDEPTTDLDPQGKYEVLALIRKLVQDQKKTAILVEHETDEILDADEVVLLADGQIKEVGSSSEILRQVDKLRSFGIKPPDLALVANKLKLPELELNIDSVAEYLLNKGVDLSRFDADKCNIDQHQNNLNTPEIIKLEDLHFSFDSEDNEILKGINLSLKEGEFIAIVGPNGGGKTTLVKHFNGLLKPTAGQVLIHGMDTSRLKLSEIGKQVAYVFQNPDHQIFAEKVIDDVAFGPRLQKLPKEEIEANVEDALKAVNLWEARFEDPFCLTKGQRQRLAVASALATRPELIIFDEPTTGLDYTELRHMIELIDRLNKTPVKNRSSAKQNSCGHTIIMITHCLWLVAQYAHRVIAVAEGKIIADLPTRKFFAESSLLKDLSLKAPPITELSQRLGKLCLSPQEFFQNLASLGIL